MEGRAESNSDEDRNADHPIWSYSGLSDEELRGILSDPDHQQFVSIAARLLESSLDVDRVFEYLDPEVFARNFERIKKSMGQGEQALKHRRFWGRMAEQGRKKLGIEEESPDEGKSESSSASESAERIGQRIRKLRREEGISQSELADRLDVSRQVISRLENGKHNPSFEKIKRVLGALGYKPNLEIVPIKED